MGPYFNTYQACLRLHLHKYMKVCIRIYIYPYYIGYFFVCIHIYIYIVYTYYNYTLYTYVLLAVSGLLMITYVHM